MVWYNDVIRLNRSIYVFQYRTCRYLDNQKYDQIYHIFVHLAQKFGVESIVGTPTVFITDKDGKVLNAETAPTWRDAASRDDEAVWDYFEGYATNK